MGGCQMRCVCCEIRGRAVRGAWIRAAAVLRYGLLLYNLLMVTGSGSVSVSIKAGMYNLIVGDNSTISAMNDCFNYNLGVMSTY